MERGKRWFKLLLPFFVIWGVLELVIPYDSTDDLASGDRSGMSLYIDHHTGCHYLKGGLLGGMTPRLDRKGQHICVGRAMEP